MLKFALVLIGLCIAVGVVFLLRTRATVPPSSPEKATDKASAPVYSALRARALTGSRTEFGLDAASPDGPAWGVLMETGFPEGSYTLVSMLDGSARLYLSGGGGVVGSSAHESIRDAATEFIRLAGQYQSSMTPTKTFPLPAEGRTVFYVLTNSDVFTAEADEEALGEERHALSPLFHAGHEVITPLRLMTDME